MTREEMEAALLARPFHRWLGLSLAAVCEDGIEIHAAWRDEWAGNPTQAHTHGGILASLIDIAADWALVFRLGEPAPTVDLRVDYHRPAAPGRLIARGRVIKYGRQISCAEAQIFDSFDHLVASGRGVYATPNKVPRPAA